MPNQTHVQSLSVRKATPADFETLLRFEQGVIAAERPFDATLKHGPIRYYDLNEMMTSPHIHLVVAEKDGQIVGSGYARIEAAKPYLQHDRHAYLGFMYVLPEHRGQGINKVIMQALGEWAATQGVTELRLDVYEQNAAAIKAYEKAGFEKLLVKMRKGI